MATIQRTGVVSFGDASLSVWEEGIAEARKSGDWKAAQDWKRQFKRDVFARIVQQLRRIGWTVTMPEIDPHHVKHYGGGVARSAAERRRICNKGDLKGDLEISGRHIEFKMFQSINCPTRPDHEGRYESDKEGVMPYVLRLEMERTRRRISNYLCGVMEGYTFNDRRGGRHWKQKGRTAMEAIAAIYEESRHFKGDWAGYLAGNNGMQYNRKSADGVMLDHGQRVWFFDRQGRICTGTAMYNINNMWWVVTGKYDYTNVACFDLYASLPENFRVKRNGALRRKRLEGLLAGAVKRMDFERAAVLRDIIFPKGEKLFVVWHRGYKCYHRANFQGYANDIVDAGKFTAEEVKGWDNGKNEVRELEASHGQ